MVLGGDIRLQLRSRWHQGLDRLAVGTDGGHGTWPLEIGTPIAANVAQSRCIVLANAAWSGSSVPEMRAVGRLNRYRSSGPWVRLRSRPVAS